MAYNRGNDDDKLPAHVQPDEAAQILAYTHSQQKPAPQRPPSNQNPAQTRPPPSQTPQPSYHNKPPPPTPTPVPQVAPLNYRRHSPAHSASSYTPQTSPYVGNNGFQQPHNYGPAHSNRLPPRSPPPTQHQHRPRTQSQGTSQGTSDAALFPLFKAVDKRGTGQLTEDELRAALVNGDFTSFDPQTVKMMIRMFDQDRSGTIGFEEFCGLWGFLAAWRTLFDRFDADGSGYISFDEYSNALLAFGYHLTPSFVSMLYKVYDKRGNNEMSFDIFVQSCLTLKRMTDVFKKYDTDRDGFITLSFEEFLT
ncbi:MAG: hypothetical protein MMC33_002806, partial [Icmadophila ericetorum]|nr:hypothetical protein [Icmadophila ericetorum]